SCILFILRFCSPSPPSSLLSFLYCPSHHRYLHSFPTRRSSDLMFFGAGNLIFPPSIGHESGEHFWPGVIGFVLTGVGQKCSPLRSEEHTSELQSRFDLVCRLLLEKKKKSDKHYTEQSCEEKQPL